MTLRAGRFIMTFTCLVLLFLAITSAVIFYLADYKSIKKSLAQKLSRLTHTRIEFAGLKASLFPVPGLELKNLYIQPTNSPSLLIESARLEFNPISLLKAKINLKKIVIKKIRFPLPSKKVTGLPDVLDVPSIPGIPALHGIPLFFPEIPFSKLPASQKELTVEIKEIQIGTCALGDAQIKLNPLDKKVSGTLEIHPAQGNEIIHADPLPESGIQYVAVKDVTVNFTYAVSEGWHFNWNLASPVIALKDSQKLTVKEISGTLLLNREKFFIKVHPFVMAPLAKYLSAEWDLALDSSKSRLDISGKNIHLGKARRLALDLFKKNDICLDLFDIIRSGEAPEIQISFENTLADLFDPKTMIIRGRIDKGVIKIPKTDLIPTDVSGTVTVTDGILKTEIEQGKIASTTLHTGTLQVDLLSDNTLFNGTFGLNTDLSMLPTILTDLLPDTLLAQEMQLLSNVRGHAQGELILDHHGNELLVGVQVKNIRLNCRYSRLPGQVTVTKGNFRFFGNSIFIDNMSGSIADNRFTNLTGSIDMSQNIDLNIAPDFFMDITADIAEFELSSLFPWLIGFVPLRENFGPITCAKGLVCLDSLDIKGPVSRPEELVYDVSGKFMDLTLGTAHHPGEISDLNGRFHLSLPKSQKHLWDIQAKVTKPHILTWVTRDTQDDTSGETLIDELALPFSLSNGEWNAGTSMTSFFGILDFFKGPTLFINLEKHKLKTHKNESYLINQISLIDEQRQTCATLSHDPNAPEKPYVFSGSLDTRSIAALLRPDAPLMHKLETWIQGSFMLAESDQGKIILTADHLDVEKFPAIPWDKMEKQSDLTSPAPTPLYDSLSHCPPPLVHLLERFTLNAKSLKIDDFIFFPFFADIDIEKNGTSIRVIESRLCDINITGNIELSPTSTDISLDFQAKQGDFSHVLNCLAEKTNLIQGTFSLTGHLAAKGNPADLSKKLNGRLSLNSKNGRIHKLTLLSRILSIINVSKFIHGQFPDIEQNGFGYQTLHIEGDVVDSRIILEKAIIDGLDMTLLFSGWIDPAARTMEITGMVAPFKTADIIIEKIPVIGTILNKRLVSFPVKISGSMDHPKVNLLLPSQVGKGILNTMQRLLETPLKFMDKP